MAGSDVDNNLQTQSNITHDKHEGDRSAGVTDSSVGMELPLGSPEPLS